MSRSRWAADAHVGMLAGVGAAQDGEEACDCGCVLECLIACQRGASV